MSKPRKEITRGVHSEIKIQLIWRSSCNSKTPKLTELLWSTQTPCQTELKELKLIKGLVNRLFPWYYWLIINGYAQFVFHCILRRVVGDLACLCPVGLSVCLCPVRVSVDVAGHKRAQSCLSLHLAAFTGSLSGPRSLAGGHNVHFVNSTCDAWSLGARCTAPNSPLLSP